MNDKHITIKNTKYNNRIFNILKVSKNNFTNTSSNDSIIKKISEKKKEEESDKICPYCYRSFYSEFNKSRHVDKIHLKKDIGQCPKCNGKFHNIENHIKKCNIIIGNRNLNNEINIFTKCENLNEINCNEFLKKVIQIKADVENIFFNSEINLDENDNKKNKNEIITKENFNIFKVDKFNFGFKPIIQDMNNKAELTENKINDFFIEVEKQTKNDNISEIIKKNMYNILTKYTYIPLDNNYFIFKNLILGHGKYGSVWFGINIKNAIPIAIKVQNNINSKDSFKLEILIMNILKKYKIFPKLYKELIINEKIFLIETLFFPNIEKVLKFCGGKFSVITIYKIGIEVLNLFKLFHKSGYLYLDLKCDNLVLLDNPIKYNNFVSNISLIDYGYCVKYINNEGSHLSQQNSPKKHGNIYYASINSLKGNAISRKDDIISLCYLLIDLINGPLPWSNLSTDNKSKIETIKLKTVYTPKILCGNDMKEVLFIFENVNNLGFCDIPNYNQYIKILDGYIMGKTKKHFNDIPFDWEEKMTEIRKKNDNKSYLKKNNKEIYELFDGYPEFYWNYYLNK